MAEKAALRNFPGKARFILLLGALLLSMTACGPKQTPDPYLGEFGDRFTSDFLLSQNPFDSNSREKDNILSANLFELSSVQGGNVYNRLLRVAHTQMGKLYRAGGTEPSTGFDCSGFTTWVYSKVGVHLPRSSREQYLEGKAVARNDLRKGDLVFFARKKRVSHVGIYLENGNFIHSTSAGSPVSISNLAEPIWEKQYVGARRVL